MKITSQIHEHDLGVSIVSEIRYAEILDNNPYQIVPAIVDELVKVASKAIFEKHKKSLIKQILRNPDILTRARFKALELAEESIKSSSRIS